MPVYQSVKEFLWGEKDDRRKPLKELRCMINGAYAAVKEIENARGDLEDAEEAAQHPGYFEIVDIDPVAIAKKELQDAEGNYKTGIWKIKKIVLGM